MRINLNTQERVKFTLFPDGQHHIKLTEIPSFGENIVVVASLVHAGRLLQLLEVVDVIKQQGAIPSELQIPYLMGARMDRVMGEGESFDLRVIANLINSMGFQRVMLYDPHSDVAPALIHNSVVVDNKFLVEKYNKSESILIIPDAGAAKKAGKYFDWNKNIVDSVQCIKHRNLSTGQVFLKVLEPEKCQGRDCVIIDDICDGGATFISIAEEIAAKTLTLIVTHGIFSKGFKLLEENFDEIITSDSFSPDESGKIVKRIKI